MIEVISTGTFVSSNADGAFSKVVGGAGDVNVSPNGKLVAVKLLHLGSPCVATAYAKITYSDVTGATGTILNVSGSGAISGAVPKMVYPAYFLADNAGTAMPGSGANLYPIWGDLLVTCGSLGSPITFSGLEIWLER